MGGRCRLSILQPGAAGATQAGHEEAGGAAGRRHKEQIPASGRMREPRPGRAEVVGNPAAPRSRSSTTSTVSARGSVHTEYVSVPPGRTQRAARASRRFCRAASRSTSSRRRRQRRSGRDAMVPSPLQGASRSTASQEASYADESSSTSACTTSAVTPRRERLARRVSTRPASASTAVTLAPGARPASWAVLVPGAAQRSRTLAPDAAPAAATRPATCEPRD